MNYPDLNRTLPFSWNVYKKSLLSNELDIQIVR